MIGYWKSNKQQMDSSPVVECLATSSRWVQGRDLSSLCGALAVIVHGKVRVSRRTATVV